MSNIQKKIENGELVRVWDQADSPVLWVEMIWCADTIKMKKYFGFVYGSHYFRSVNQTTTFYKNIVSEKRAEMFGQSKYSSLRFVKMYCKQSVLLEKKLEKIVYKITNSDLAKQSSVVLLDYFNEFFEVYASFMAFYRLSRPEFYANLVTKSDEISKSLRSIGERRFAMHHVWMRAFREVHIMLKEIGRRGGLSTLAVKNCTRKEINDLLNNKTIMLSEIKKRIMRFEFIYKRNKFYLSSVITRLTEVVIDKNEIKGQVAFTGVVRGEVLLVHESLRGISLSDIKIKENSILVTMMTSPDMLPLMKKALAFVTDEGGLLCHAAIIARDMKKPCIIGTKVATKVLKDGDMVEVDTNKGLVKILKRV
ncbi:MAG: hypothetical protein HYV67_02585 [Candidatus Taylorbacteria bacterium]|nr:hypothetical protein [Candidatus Taylorbacteria bacterium]